MRLTSKDFVDALYRGLLDREPDGGGLDHHVSVLDASTSPTIAADMLRNFVASDEFRRRRTPADLLQLFQTEPKSPDAAPPFAHVASLGSHCYASTVLKTMGLKRYSLPFDWIFSSLPMVIHCIEDEFATFLDPAEYRSNPIEHRPEPTIGLCDHDFYRREYGITHVFNHADPNDLAQHAYLIRAAARFTRLLASPDRKLFFAAVPTQQPAALITPFTRLAQVLQEHTSNFELNVVALLPRGGLDDFSHTVLHRRGDHTLSVLQPLSQMQATALQFQDPFDEIFVRRLIARHRFALATTI